MITNTQKCIVYLESGKPHQLTINEVAEKIPPGWRPLVRELCHKLFDAGWDGKLSQIKEKFGGLRFYAYTHNDLIDVYETQSYKICQKCSSIHKVKTHDINGWLTTLCANCKSRIKNDRASS